LRESHRISSVRRGDPFRHPGELYARRGERGRLL